MTLKPALLAGFLFDNFRKYVSKWLCHGKIKVIK